MGPLAVREYAAVMRQRYRVAGNRGEKGGLLDEFCAVTGYHRKAAVRLLGREQEARRRRGRARQYGPVVAGALRRVWEASGQLGSKRLVPFLPELVAALERHQELELAPPVRASLLSLSARTMDRLLQPWRPKGLRRPYRPSPAPGSLRAQVPVRTFGEWQGVAPGSVQADLVLHCGESTEGFYLATLDVVDVATGWTECEPTWGLGQERVRSALDRIRRRLPFPLRELHTDNGSEFLNRVLYPYCQRYGIRMTRGRPYKKNDQAYVEQKNWSVVRRQLGYGRYGTQAAYQHLQRLYLLLCRQVNFFHPLAKLVSKERVGAKVTKRYDDPRTPYQRLRAAGLLGKVEGQTLERRYEQVNPVRLQAEVEAALESLWQMETRTVSARPRSGVKAS